jgi:hypothetical protein
VANPFRKSNRNSSSAKKAKKAGDEFEESLEAAFLIYRMRRLAKIHKIDPPMYYDSKKQAFMPSGESNFLDFGGCWSERGGQALWIEAKSTQGPYLQLGHHKDGLKNSQWNNLLEWEGSGAAVMLVWKSQGVILHAGTADIKRALADGRSSLTADYCRPVPCNPQRTHIDVLAAHAQYMLPNL